MIEEDEEAVRLYVGLRLEHSEACTADGGAILPQTTPKFYRVAYDHVYQLIRFTGHPYDFHGSNNLLFKCR